MVGQRKRVVPERMQAFLKIKQEKDRKAEERREERRKKTLIPSSTSPHSVSLLRERFLIEMKKALAFRFGPKQSNLAVIQLDIAEGEVSGWASLFQPDTNIQKNPRKEKWWKSGRGGSLLLWSKIIHDLSQIGLSCSDGLYMYGRQGVRVKPEGKIRVRCKKLFVLEKLRESDRSFEIVRGSVHKWDSYHLRVNKQFLLFSLPLNILMFFF